MDRAFTYQEERETAHENQQQQQQQQDYYKLKLCIPIVSHRSSSIKSQSLFSFFGFWVSKSVRNLCGKARFSNVVCLKRLHFNGMVVNNSVFCDWPAVVHMEEEKVEKVCSLEKDVEKIEEVEEKLSEKRSEVQTFGELIEEKSRESSSSSDFLTSETTGHEEEEEQSHSSFEESFSHEATDCGSSNGVNDEVEKPHFDDRKFEKQSSSLSETEMMKERFSKLLLGEDMSGSGNGVCTALAISNAITNLCATLFGQLWRLEPVPHEKKVMWRREMEWLLSVSDHIVELIPSWQTFPDGSKLEVMTSRPRSDLYINLPALRKLDNMLLEILDSFENTEFWYVDQGILAPESDGSSSFRRALQRQEEKWWLPVPRVPPGGLDENSRKQLQHRRDSTNQILKAAMAINNIALTDMEVPESYLEALPKNGKACLGDIIYRYISSDQFSPDCLLECLDLSSEHQAIELANQVEASIYVWRKRPNPKPARNATRSSSKSSWDFVKELVIDGDKRELLADRAESLLLCLKLWFSGLPQTALDMSKIQYNKDVGKSILESYSRVLESLAFNIIARIDDLLYVDDLTKHSDHFSSISKVSVIAHKTVTIPYSVPAASTPYKTAFTTPNFSPSNLVSPMKGERSPFMTSAKIAPRGFGVKKVLTDYLSIDSKTKDSRGGDGNEGTNGSFRKGSFGRIDDMEHVKQGVSLKSSPTQNSSKEE